MQVALGVDVSQVGLHRVLGQNQHFCDIGCAAAFGEKGEDVLFACGELVGVRKAIEVVFLLVAGV